jgi:hypothetical protein
VYTCVFFLRQESIDMILTTNPSLSEWGCHTYGVMTSNSGERGAWGNLNGIDNEILSYLRYIIFWSKIVDLLNVTWTSKK